MSLTRILTLSASLLSLVGCFNSDLGGGVTESLLEEEDTCENALRAFERCDWGTQCVREVRDAYPESEEAGWETFTQCYIGTPRCEGLTELCEEERL